MGRFSLIIYTTTLEPPIEFFENSSVLRTFARKFSNIDFFLKILPLKDDESVMSEM